MRILIASKDFPYPPDHGGRADIWSRIAALREQDISVDLVATTRSEPSQESIEVVQQKVDRLLLLRRERGWRSHLSVVPFEAYSRRALRTVKLERDYSAVLLEGESTAFILDNPQLRARRRILRVHNNESRYFSDLCRSTSSVARKLFYASESAKYSFYSPAVMKRCDLLWFISQDEMANYSAAQPDGKVKCWFVPSFIDVTTMRTRSLAGSVVLYIGDLSVASNVSGLEWYLKNVHRDMCEVAGYKLVLAGRSLRLSDEKVIGFERKYAKVEVTRNPPELDGLYDRAAVFINPVFRGAGIKLKTIHAIHAGLPVVSTTTGCEGTGLVNQEHLLIVNDAPGFLASIRKLLDDTSYARSLVEKGQRYLRLHYSQTKVLRDSLAGAG
jgi:polysaccharide biosynthesis protein PslH